MISRLSKAPIAAEAVNRTDVLFAVECAINGPAPHERLHVRPERSRPLIVELQAWLREQRAKLSWNNNTTKAINYCLSRWDAFPPLPEPRVPMHVEQRHRSRATGCRRRKKKLDLGRLRLGRPARRGDLYPYCQRQAQRH